MMMGKTSPDKLWVIEANVSKTATSPILRTTNGCQSLLMQGLPYSKGRRLVADKPL